MNILRVPEVGATVSGGDKARPTSCEGYVTKRGHFRKSWRVRFLLLDGADLQVSYFESRAACHPPQADAPVPKGSFYLSNIEPHEYVVGVMGAADKPFGFKMVGHAPRKGYVELDVFVETLGDRSKWLEVARNALSAKRQLTRQAIDQSVSPNKMSLFGFSLSSAPSQTSMSPKKQMQTLVTSKEVLLADALREIEAAKLVGREACTEMVSQGEKLDAVEQDLSAIDRDLDFGDKLLRRLKSPTLHLFSDDTRPKAQATSKGNSQQSGSSPTRFVSAIEERDSAGGSELERLAQALGELEIQAELLNGEAARSTQQITRIEEQLASVSDRVEKQTKQASATLHAGARLF
ncbi:hypothetical protein BBJ28_00006435 [Nothophytophthora sp. Chile5]|nr:hypothetical protein BBJ28_00006435 [Nothophytophthora sp. Chile5]